ncbi:hypothetical protein [Glaciibacter sp. 2TAF33]|uniref:hypothetical protein n=1 Tax=Glaciibacter sp. 2TAF33 TaxID=3233015 RepID=UPI003F907DC0
MAAQQQVPARERRRKRLWLIGISTVVVLLAGTLVVANLAASRDNAASTNSSTGSASPNDKNPAVSPAPMGSPAPTGPATPDHTPAPGAEQPVVEPTPPPELPPVAFTKPVAPVTGLVFSLSALEAVQGVARGPGEVAGPALRFALTIRNDTAATVSLESTVVNLYFGADQNPATDLQEPGGVPLPPEVASGTSATAVLIFAVPAAERDKVKIAVDYSVGVPIVVFEGRAPR